MTQPGTEPGTDILREAAESPPENSPGALARCIALARAAEYVSDLDHEVLRARITDACEDVACGYASHEAAIERIQSLVGMELMIRDARGWREATQTIDSLYG